MAYIDNAKQWFKRKMKPTEAQFAQTFDWLRWKDQALAIADITSLSTTLQGKLDKSVFDAMISRATIVLEADGSFVIPAGYLLEKVLLIPAVASVISIGTTEGGEEVFLAGDVSTDGAVIALNVFTKVAKTIYFTGITSSTTIALYYSKIIDVI